METKHPPPRCALPPFPYIGRCHACGRPLFENNRVLLRGRLLYCETCQGPPPRARTLGELWQCFVQYFTLGRPRF